jgi:hypothetical protein
MVVDCVYGESFASIQPLVDLGSFSVRVYWLSRSQVTRYGAPFLKQMPSTQACLCSTEVTQIPPVEGCSLLSAIFKFSRVTVT